MQVLFVLSLILNLAFGSKLTGSPTKEEQNVLLQHVGEIFEAIKAVVRNEGVATDESVINDVTQTTHAASQHLQLVQELALLNVSDASDKEATKKIEGAMAEAEEHLRRCVEDAGASIYQNSALTSSSTEVAMNQGEALLNTLNQCSKKNGLQQLTCYKKIMIADVFPLKLVLLDTLKLHKEGHLQAIFVRQTANECVDFVLKTHRDKLAKIVDKAVVVVKS